jgi:hypothetical protein
MSFFVFSLVFSILHEVHWSCHSLARKFTKKQAIQKFSFRPQTQNKDFFVGFRTMYTQKLWLGLALNLWFAEYSSIQNPQEKNRIVFFLEGPPGICLGSTKYHFEPHLFDRMWDQ